MDARYDDFFVVFVGGVVGHPEGLEAFPCPALLVPKIFDSGATRIGMVRPSLQPLTPRG